MGATNLVSDVSRYRLLSNRLIAFRAGGLFFLSLILLAAQSIHLPLDYTHLFIISAEWLMLHWFVVLSQRKWQVTSLSISLQLLADIAIVSSLLAFSGGAHNPFFATILLPLLLTVGILPLSAQYLLLSGVLIAASLLVLTPHPFMHSLPQLPNSLYALLFWIDGQIVPQQAYNPLNTLSKLGLWLNLTLIAVLVSFFLSRLHLKLQHQQTSLQEVQSKLNRQEQLLAISLQTATTAHELSTPLASISLLASEAKDAFAHQETEEASAALIQIQSLVKQCKHQIDRSLEMTHNPRINQLTRTTWQAFLSLQIHQFNINQPNALIHLNAQEEALQSTMFNLPSLTMTITSLLNNALQASNSPIVMELSKRDANIHLCFINSDQCFTEEQLKRFPEPQLSSKADGHGLGLTLAYTTLTQLGGSLQISNQSQKAHVCLQLPEDPNQWTT